MTYIKYISIYTYNIKIYVIYISRNLKIFNGIINSIFKVFSGGVQYYCVFISMFYELVIVMFD